MSRSPAAPGVPTALPVLIERLATAAVASRIHPPAHPSLTRPVAAAVELIEQILAETETDSFSLISFDDGLFFQGQTPVQSSMPGARLVEVIKRWNAAGLRVLAGITVAELGTFLRLLVRPDAIPDLAGLAQTAAQSGCRRIGLIASSSGAMRSAHAAGPVANLEQIHDTVSDAFTGVAAGADMDFESMTRTAESILKCVDSTARADGRVLDLSRHDGDDTLSVQHAIRVSALSMVAARAICRDPALVIRLGVAGLLHDVGRMLLPLDLMQSESAQDDESSTLMLEHPALGAEYLMSHDDADPLSVAIALGHHRTATGLGYPPTPHEHQVSKFTQLVRIADVFEALTARRPHRPPLSPIRAYRTLVLRDHGVDAGLLRRFIEANGIHPLGAVVELDTGETAQVVRQSASALAPILRVLTPGDSGAPRGGLIDLSRPRNTKVAIVGSASPST